MKRTLWGKGHFMKGLEKELAMNERAAHIVSVLERRIGEMPFLHALIGFDGYIDELMRVVESRDSAGTASYFQDITGFSRRIAAAAGRSADLEVVTDTIKLGGNGPIMANALAGMGVPTVCIGAMGYPGIRAEFRAMPADCRSISLCQPAHTHALEFNDGKLMFADLAALEQLTWETIIDQIGRNDLASLFRESSLIALVNWSGVPGADRIWHGIYQEILPELDGEGLAGQKGLCGRQTGAGMEEPHRRRQVFFDLADPSKRTKEDIQSVLSLIRSYEDYCDVMLGLNENEALCLAASIGRGCAGPEEAALRLYDLLGISAVVVHPIDRCIVVTADGLIAEQGHVVEAPKISTGGGDNFNAGFCLGQLLGLGYRDSMLLGMAVSGYYVENGKSPSAQELAGHLMK